MGNRKRKLWTTLYALYLTEFSVCARSDLSLAAAKELLAAAWLRHAAHPDFFRHTARHIAATGERHAKRYFDAARLLDTTINDIEKFCKKPSPFGDRLWRVLFIPSSLTLAGALGDLGRSTERRFYLKWAFRHLSHVSNTDAKRYWRNAINLDLFLAEVDSDFTGKFTNGPFPHPRLENKRRLAMCEPKVLNPDDLDEWVKNEMWNLAWHAVEPRQMGVRVIGMVKESKKLKELKKLNDGRILENKVQELLGYVKQLLDKEASRTTCGLSFLVKPFTSSMVEDIPDSERRILWEQAKGLFELSDKHFLSTSTRRKELEEWNKLLKGNLKEGGKRPLFQEVCSEVERLKLLAHKPNSHATKCENSPTGKKGKDRQTCPNNPNFEDGCAYKFVQDESGDTQPTCRLSWEYYWKTMKDQAERYRHYMDNWTGRERQYVQGGRLVDAPDFEFVSLQRWNSFSPNLGSRATNTVGGGYLVRARISPPTSPEAKAGDDHYLGIAIDPGYNFLENLFNEGFTIADIDIIAITHAHPDHTENLTNLLTLVHERNKRGHLTPQLPGSPTIDHKPILVTTEGVFKHFQQQLGEHENLRDIVVIATRKSIRNGAACRKSLFVWKDSENIRDIRWRLSDQDVAFRPRIKLSSGPAWHDDSTGHDSIGLIVSYEPENGSTDKCQLGVLGDTRYNWNLGTAYKKCKVLVTHLGSLVDLQQKNAPDPKALRDLYQTKNHLYLPGFTRLLCDLKESAPLFVLSEFGEELRSGLRTDIAPRISSMLDKDCPRIIPADVGLRIDLMDQTLLCCVCHRFVESTEITPKTVLPDTEALAYICHDCEIARRDELPKLLEEWCQSARPLTIQEVRKKQ